jgi:hypothetical protein
MADYPIAECEAACEFLFKAGAVVRQKWTCKHCGSRRTQEVPNKFFTSGYCDECNRVTDIENCNYIIGIKDGTPVEVIMQWLQGAGRP